MVRTDTRIPSEISFRGAPFPPLFSSSVVVLTPRPGANARNGDSLRPCRSCSSTAVSPPVCSFSMPRGPSRLAFRLAFPEKRAPETRTLSQNQSMFPGAACAYNSDAWFRRRLIPPTGVPFFFSPFGALLVTLALLPSLLLPKQRALLGGEGATKQLAGIVRRVQEHEKEKLTVVRGMLLNTGTIDHYTGTKRSCLRMR